MLQRLRDESHRFAISYHRQLRDKRMTRSVLDGIPGLGDTRRTKLVKQFGGVRAVQRASLEDLLEVTWLPEAVAHTVYEHLHPEAARSAAPDDGQSSDGGVGSDDG
jgi:excinuclease ABC subunit C